VEEKKWKPASLDDIEIGKRIEPKVTKPAVTEKEIEQALSGISSTPSKKTTPGPVGNPNEISAYDAHIYSVFYNAWAQPASQGVRPAEVTISISSSGRIVSSRLSQSSGDATFDATVMTAVLSVTVLPKKPPAGYPLDNIVVQFRIID
jgi:TonB family protein